jgi:hypothetical protein
MALFNDGISFAVVGPSRLSRMSSIVDMIGEERMEFRRIRSIWKRSMNKSNLRVNTGRAHGTYVFTGGAIFIGIHNKVINSLRFHIGQ